MGKRVSIYVPDDLVGSIQEAAKMDGRSVSNYLIQLHKNAIGMCFIDESGSISEEVYNNIKTGNKPAQPDKFESHKGVVPDIKKVVTKKQEKPIWANPLADSALAPKK